MSPRQQKKGKQALYGLLILAGIILLLHGHLLITDSLPNTDGPGYLERAIAIRDGYEWHPRGQLGYPVTTFDPPLAYDALQLPLKLFPRHPIRVFNAYFFILLMASAGLWYGVLLSLRVRPFLALFPIALVYALPAFQNMFIFQGNIKLLFAYTYLALLALSITQAPGDRPRWVRHPAATGMFLAGIALSHTSLAPFAAIFTAAVLWGQWRRLLAAAGAAAIMALSWIVPLLHYMALGFGNTIVKYRMPGLWGLLAGEGAWLLLALGGLISLLWPTLRRRREDIVMPHPGTRFIYCWLMAWIGVAVLGVLPPLNGVIVDWGRIAPALYLGLAMDVAVSMERLWRESWKPAGPVHRRLFRGIPRKTTALVPFAFILALALVPGWSHSIGSTTPVLGSHIRHPFPDIQAAANDTQHRMTTYGYHNILTHPTLAIAYGANVHGYGFRQGQAVNVWENLLNGGNTMDVMARARNATPFPVALRALEETSTKYIFFWTCGETEAARAGRRVLARFRAECPPGRCLFRPGTPGRTPECRETVILPGARNLSSHPYLRLSPDTVLFWRNISAGEEVIFREQWFPRWKAWEYARMCSFHGPGCFYSEPIWNLTRRPRWKTAWNWTRQEAAIDVDEWGFMHINKTVTGPLVLEYRKAWWERLLAYPALIMAALLAVQAAAPWIARLNRRLLPPRRGFRLPRF